MKVFFKARRFCAQPHGIFSTLKGPRREKFEEAQRDLEAFPEDPLKKVFREMCAAVLLGDKARAGRLNWRLRTLQNELGYDSARDIVEAEQDEAG